MKTHITFIVLLVILITSCTDHSSNTEENQVATHEDVNLKLTGYNQEYEVYAEAAPFVVGKQSRVLSHFSNLPNFTAVEEGSITLHLRIGSKEVTQQLTQPTRKGIYAFDITPTSEGSGTLSYVISNKRGTSELVVDGITVYSKEEQATESAKKQLKTSPFGAVFTKEQSWKINFATDCPTVEPFGNVIKTSAQVRSAQGDEMVVAARASGIVLFSSGDLLEGKSIGAGQSLFTISGSSFADNNSSVRFTEAQNNYEKAKADYERMKSLSQDKIVPEKDLLAAKNLFDNTKAIFDNLNANFSAKGQHITSPMSGFVRSVYVKNGQYVEAGQPLLAVSKNRTLIISAEVQQKYAGILGNITNANLRTFHGNKTYSLKELNGKLLSFGHSLSENNYLIPVNLEIDNKSDFIPGSFIELYLKTITNSQALTIPNDALMEDQGTFYVYVQIYPELFERREVKPGATDGIRTEVITGIATGDRIITKGAALVKLAQATSSLDAHSGHNH